MLYLHIKLLLITFILSVFLLGCSEAEIERHMEETLFSYERAIRWLSLVDASAFQKRPEHITDEEIQRHKKIRVTAYNVIQIQYAPKKVMQMVEIRYYHKDNPVERSMIDRQTWEYDEERERWYLITALPRFK